MRVHCIMENRNDHHCSWICYLRISINLRVCTGNRTRKKRSKNVTDRPYFPKACYANTFFFLYVGLSIQSLTNINFVNTYKWSKIPDPSLLKTFPLYETYLRKKIFRGHYCDVTSVWSRKLQFYADTQQTSEQSKTQLLETSLPEKLWCIICVYKRNTCSLIEQV